MKQMQKIPPSLQQRQKTSYSSVVMISLQHFSTSTGMLSFRGALPEARESKAAFISAKVGSLSNSSKTGRHSMLFDASSVTTFSLEYSSEQCSTHLEKLLASQRQSQLPKKIGCLCKPTQILWVDNNDSHVFTFPVAPHSDLMLVTTLVKKEEGPQG